MPPREFLTMRARLQTRGLIDAEFRLTRAGEAYCDAVVAERKGRYAHGKPGRNLMNDRDLELLMAWRWSNGRPECPECGHSQFYIITTRNQFRCKACRHTFSVTSGTIFHALKTSAKNVITILQALNENPETAVAEIVRRTGMSYKGAHYLVARIRSQRGLDA
jgi:transposase-like protein